MKEQRKPKCPHKFGKRLYAAFMAASVTPALTLQAFAADTIWTKASAIMKDVYAQIVSISSVAAVVCASVALLLMNFSRSDRTVQESRSWLKRIIISWAILNGLGYQAWQNAGAPQDRLLILRSGIERAAPVWSRPCSLNQKR